MEQKLSITACQHTQVPSSYWLFRTALSWICPLGGTLVLFTTPRGVIWLQIAEYELTCSSTLHLQSHDKFRPHVWSVSVKSAARARVGGCDSSFHYWNPRWGLQIENGTWGATDFCVCLFVCLFMCNARQLGVKVCRHVAAVGASKERVLWIPSNVTAAGFGFVFFVNPKPSSGSARD